MNYIGVRHMRLDDLDAVIQLERQANLHVFEIPGIGECESIEPWAWTRQDLLAALRQYRSKERGTYEARVFVAGTAEQLHGVAVMEIQDEGFEIRRLSALDDFSRQALVDKVLAMAAASRKRRRVSCCVSDGDWACLSFFVKLGWKRTLLPNHFPDGRDGWHCQTSVTMVKRAMAAS